MSYTILPSLSANKVLTASYLDLLNDNLIVVGNHNHSGSLGEGSLVFSISGSLASPFVYCIEVQCNIAPSQTNWGTDQYSLNYLFGHQLGKTTASAASLKFPISLFRGTYELLILFDDQVSSGSTKIVLAGGSIGSISNTGAANLNTVCRISNIGVTNSASTILAFETASGTNWRIGAFKMRRTGN